MGLTAAVIGTGPNPDDPSADGFAMGYEHADALTALDGVELVGCADIVRENALAFADEYDLEIDAVFDSHTEMVARLEPDLVTIAVPPAVHADIAIACAESGVVDGIHCEKPMALTWGDSQRMAEVAARHGVQLTFNHQRRFGKPFRRAKSLLDDGEIGTLQTVQFAAPNLYDYGSHSFDLSNYFADQATPTWVMGQIDYRNRNIAFGAHNENQGLVQWRYDDGVYGLATTGAGDGLVGCHNRLVGNRGVIEIAPSMAENVALRIRRDGQGWERIDTDGEHQHGPGYIERAVADVVDALRTGEPSELRAENALDATKLIFGAWESARRRGRVEFPLEITDNPLESMVESGSLSPTPADESAEQH